MDLTIRILKVLASGEHRKTELYDLADAETVDAELVLLANGGMVRRVGKFGPARYAITAKGRKLPATAETTAAARPPIAARAADGRIVLVRTDAPSLPTILGPEYAGPLAELLLKKAA